MNEVESYFICGICGSRMEKGAIFVGPGYSQQSIWEYKCPTCYHSALVQYSSICHICFSNIIFIGSETGICSNPLCSSYGLVWNEKRYYLHSFLGQITLGNCVVNNAEKSALIEESFCNFKFLHGFMTNLWNIKFKEKGIDLSEFHIKLAWRE